MTSRHSHVCAWRIIWLGAFDRPRSNGSTKSISLRFCGCRQTITDCQIHHFWFFIRWTLFFYTDSLCRHGIKRKSSLFLLQLSCIFVRLLAEEVARSDIVFRLRANKIMPGVLCGIAFCVGQFLGRIPKWGAISVCFICILILFAFDEYSNLSENEFGDGFGFWMTAFCISSKNRRRFCLFLLWVLLFICKNSYKIYM